MSGPIELAPSEFRRMSTSSLSDWDEVVKEENTRTATLRGPALTGLATIILGVGGFFLWASQTPVAQASVAGAKVIVESNTKTITHLEGGTLQALMVKEGQMVREGTLLATLDVTRSQSMVTQLRQQLFVLDVKLARLIAEKDETPEFAFNEDPPAGVERAMASELVSTERKLFSERRSQFADQLAADRSMVKQLESQRVALEARRKSSVAQAVVIRRDYETLAGLEKKQLAIRGVVSEKQLQLVEMESKIAEVGAELAENSQRKMQAELSLSNRRTEYFRFLSEQIQAAQADIARVRQEIIAAEDIVEKSAIRSPQIGVISNIKIRTPGSAVIAGQPILDIVPANQPMLIEGLARAMDIDTIRVGERVEVRLSSFGGAEARPLGGHVTYIAPDGMADERTGEITYVFRAKIDDGELQKQPNLFLYPGMATEVFIVNGTRTALAYLMLPIMKSFSRAFREQ